MGASSARPTTERFASSGTSSAALDTVHTETNGHTSVPSVETSDTMRCQAPVGPPPSESFLDVARPPALSYPSFSTTIIPCPPFDPDIHSHPDILNKIVHPYNADAFDLFLDRHNLRHAYPELVSNLRNGFPIGRMPSLTSTNVIANHSSVATHFDAVATYLEDEVRAGRMSGPFTQQEVERILRGPFQCSPLIVAVQPQAPGEPDKLRICRHLSKSTKLIPSVNSFIEKEDFPTRFDTACRVAEMVAVAPPGTQACTLDIEKFHRTCPVHPSHKCWLVLQGQDSEFYIDHDHPFGASCASSNAGMIANAVVDIWIAEGVEPVLKYEDDLKVFRHPVTNGLFEEGGYRYHYDRSEILRRIASLNVPWHPEKGDLHFSSITTFIGLRWDLIQHQVSLPDQKRRKFLRRVQDFITSFSRQKCSLRDVDKIHGSLCYLTVVYLAGRSRLPSLSNFAAKFKGNEYLEFYPPRSMISDLHWWQEVLSQEAFFRQLVPRGPVSSLSIFVDASTSWGIGLLVDGKWKAFRLEDDWKIEGRDICWLETLAVEFIAYILEAMDIRDCQVVIHSDNQGTIGSMGKGRSPNFHINLAVRRTYSVLSSLFVTPSFIYIPSEENPADPISRGELGNPADTLDVAFELPGELADIFSHVY
jgi:hypothetical protein